LWYNCGGITGRKWAFHFSKHPTLCGGEILLDKMPSKYTRDFLLVVTTSYCLSRREVNLNANSVQGKGGSLVAAESHTSNKDLVFSMCKSIYLHCQWYNGMYMLLGWSVAFKYCETLTYKIQCSQKGLHHIFNKRPHLKKICDRISTTKKYDGIYACYFGWSVAFRQHEIEVGFINMYNLQCSKRVSRIQSRQLSRMIGWVSGISIVYHFILSCLWLGNLSEFVVFWQKAWNFFEFFPFLIQI
jgi:hypothetical protein